MHQFTRIGIAGFILIMFAACAPGNRNEVYFDHQREHDYHIVSLGDTLYSIAWRQGMHYVEVARWNNIHPPYTIYAGQQLRLTPPPAGSKAYANKSKSDATKKAVVGGKAAKTTASSPAKKKKASEPVAYDWHWPTKGKVIGTYKAGGNKGIDIAGKLGQPVFAASSGKVVYSGNGLSGYGNLIIVKHSEQFLSAYAHNRRLLVQEGGAVTRGQKIAELGSTGTKSPKLHFEIRRNGKPVDPTKYLPKN